MEPKKWPIFAQILIALGLISSILSILHGLSDRDILNVVFGAAGIVIFGAFYKFKSWALIGLNILLGLKILFLLIAVLSGFPLLFGLIVINITGFVIYYFNTPSIKKLLV